MSDTKLLAVIFSALFFILSTIVFGLNEKTLEFSVNYFRERNVPFICLITCEDPTWNVKFAKAASNYSMPASVLDIKYLSNDDIQQCFRQHFSVTGVLLDAKCENAEKILNSASQNMWLDSAHTWLILDDYKHLGTKNESIEFIPIKYEEIENSLKTVKILYKQNISIDADIVLALPNGDNFNLYDIHNFGKVQGGSLVIEEAGTWSRETGGRTVAELNKNKYYKRWNFKQLAMRVISVATTPTKDFNPELLTEIRPVPGIATITRISTMILAVVAEIHNIKFVHTITDRWIGSYDKNASRVVVSGLYFREQDVTTILRFQKSIFDKVTFIQPAVTYLETRYFYRIPTTGPGNFENQFLRPLSSEAWCYVVGVCALCAIILMMTARLEARPSSVQYGLFSVMASFCQQFFEDEAITIRVSTEFTDYLKCAARKLTIFVTGVSCVLIYNYYTSSVVSWLLNGPPPSINSLEELMESPLELIYQDVGYTRTWLNTPGYYFNKRNAKIEDRLREKVLSKKRTTEITQTSEQGIAMVKAGGYAYHIETYSANTLISEMFDQTEICELGSLGSMEKTMLYPAVQKNSPYKEFFTWSLTRLLERGIISCIQRRVTPKPVLCEGSSPRALALGGAAPAFILLAFGFLLGTGIMMVERCIYKMKHGLQRQI